MTTPPIGRARRPQPPAPEQDPAPAVPTVRQRATTALAVATAFVAAWWLLVLVLHMGVRFLRLLWRVT